MIIIIVGLYRALKATQFMIVLYIQYSSLYVLVRAQLFLKEAVRNH